MQRCRKHLKEHCNGFSLDFFWGIKSWKAMRNVIFIHIDYQYFVIAVVALEDVMRADIMSALTHHASKMKLMNIYI